MSWESDLDQHITGNYGEDAFRSWGRCPFCGASQEDAEFNSKTDMYECVCGRSYSNDEANPDPRDDEPADLDERRDEDEGY